jgi:hypothetical protein
MNNKPLFMIVVEPGTRFTTDILPDGQTVIRFFGPASQEVTQIRMQATKPAAEPLAAKRPWIMNNRQLNHGTELFFQYHKVWYRGAVNDGMIEFTHKRTATDSRYKALSNIVRDCSYNPAVCNTIIQETNETPKARNFRDMLRIGHEKGPTFHASNKQDQRNEK